MNLSPASQGQGESATGAADPKQRQDENVDDDVDSEGTTTKTSNSHNTTPSPSCSWQQTAIHVSTQLQQQQQQQQQRSHQHQLQRVALFSETLEQAEKAFESFTTPTCSVEKSHDDGFPLRKGLDAPMPLRSALSMPPSVSNGASNPTITVTIELPVNNMPDSTTNTNVMPRRPFWKPNAVTILLSEALDEDASGCSNGSTAPRTLPLSTDRFHGSDGIPLSVRAIVEDINADVYPLAITTTDRFPQERNCRLRAACLNMQRDLDKTQRELSRLEQRQFEIQQGYQQEIEDLRKTLSLERKVLRTVRQKEEVQKAQLDECERSRQRGASLREASNRNVELVKKDNGRLSKRVNELESILKTTEDENRVIALRLKAAEGRSSRLPYISKQIAENLRRSEDMREQLDEMILKNSNLVLQLQQTTSEKQELEALVSELQQVENQNVNRASCSLNSNITFGLEASLHDELVRADVNLLTDHHRCHGTAIGQKYCNHSLIPSLFTETTYENQIAGTREQHVHPQLLQQSASAVTGEDMYPQENPIIGKQDYESSHTYYPPQAPAIRPYAPECVKDIAVRPFSASESQYNIDPEGSDKDMASSKSVKDSDEAVPLGDASVSHAIYDLDDGSSDAHSEDSNCQSSQPYSLESSTASVSMAQPQDGSEHDRVHGQPSAYSITPYDHSRDDSEEEYGSSDYHSSESIGWGTQTFRIMTEDGEELHRRPDEVFSTPAGSHRSRFRPSSRPHTATPFSQEDAQQFLQEISILLITLEQNTRAQYEDFQRSTLLRHQYELQQQTSNFTKLLELQRTLEQEVIELREEVWDLQDDRDQRVEHGCDTAAFACHSAGVNTQIHAQEDMYVDSGTRQTQAHMKLHQMHKPLQHCSWAMVRYTLLVFTLCFLGFSVLLLLDLVIHPKGLLSAFEVIHHKAIIQHSEAHPLSMTLDLISYLGYRLAWEVDTSFVPS
ncbi:hypothetical protein EDD11_002368 [Mortierella claussenii]|nr:hypothetical protein EDD11_002368 [Mortierella claussenii]